MKPLHKFSKEFFDKYDNEPVKLLPFELPMQNLADKYIDITSKLLAGSDVKICKIGSVAYKIPASDVEIAVYTTSQEQEAVTDILQKHFGEPVQRESEFSRFKIRNENYKMGVHVYSGYEAEVSKRMTKFMLDNPRLIDEYADIKKKYCFSRKEYQYQKDLFLNKVTEEIPEII
jgi:hypothetical protein